MTQPSPEDDLPPGPWSVIQFGFEWDVVAAESVGFICRVRTEPIASAIAAIPEMRAELREAKMKYESEVRLVDEVEKDCDRLRAEKAELIELLTARLIRRYRHANETVKTSSEGSTSAPEGS
jgi:hypothetical protein